ncbi:dihydroceramidase [Acrasis kona]|uniref:Dihydroceramidase n=1 Tax=Acrasis kona TaxID=1008807 RepID=A0AAW2Z8S3_9EUKA
MENNHAPYWGKPTANINWCEPDYVHSPYIAETFNTFSNLVYLFVAISGFLRIFRSVPKESSISRIDLLRFYILHLCAVAVFIGSSLFHATLLKQCQLMDELPMLYSTFCGIYCFIYVNDRVEKSHYRLLVISICVVFCGMLTFMMIYWPNIYAPFIISFAVLLSLCNLFICRYAFKTKASGVRTDIEKKKLILWGAYMVSLITALFVWSTDNAFCGYVQKLHLHSFWHLFSSMALSYMYDFFFIIYLDENNIPFTIEGNVLFLPRYSILDTEKKNK